MLMKHFHWKMRASRTMKLPAWKQGWFLSGFCLILWAAVYNVSSRWIMFYGGLSTRPWHCWPANYSWKFSKISQKKFSIKIFIATEKKFTKNSQPIHFSLQHGHIPSYFLTFLKQKLENSYLDFFINKKEKVWSFQGVLLVYDFELYFWTLELSTFLNT